MRWLLGVKMPVVNVEKFWRVVSLGALWTAKAYVCVSVSEVGQVVFS